MMLLHFTSTFTLMMLIQLVSGAKHVNFAQLAQINDSQSLKRRDTGSDVKTQLHIPANADLQEKNSFVSAQGTTIKRYQETYKGIKIYDTVVDTETQDATDNDVVAGDYYTDLDEDLADALECNLSNQDAKVLILQYFKAGAAKIVSENYEDMIYIDKSSNGPVAKYTSQVSLMVNDDNGLLIKLIGFVDKCDKVVLFAYDAKEHVAIQAQNNVYMPSKSATTAKVPDLDEPIEDECDIKTTGGNPNKPIPYGTTGFCLPPMDKSDDGTTCFLQNQYVKILNAHNTDDASFNPESFPCSDGYSDSNNGGYTPAYDTFFFVTNSFYMYDEWYGVNPMPNTTVLAVVHFKQKNANAEFATTKSGLDIMLVGDGNSHVYPFSVVDIIGHELGHGVVNHNSALEYREQSGGINEAFADMAGEATELFIFGKNDLKIGTNLFKSSPAYYLRSFKNPALDKKSIMHVSKYTNDSDVHHSSGIYNHVFWQMVNVNNMGMFAAFECFLFANNVYWHATSTFESAACGVMRATYDRGYDMDIVKKSFAVVGITLKECPDLSNLVTSTLKPGIQRHVYVVSELRNPLFKVVMPADTSSLTATVTRGAKISISYSYKRSDTPLSSGEGSATSNVTPGNTVFIRVYMDDDTEVYDVDIYITAN